MDINQFQEDTKFCLNEIQMENYFKDIIAKELQLDNNNSIRKVLNYVKGVSDSEFITNDTYQALLDLIDLLKHLK